MLPNQLTYDLEKPAHPPDAHSIRMDICQLLHQEAAYQAWGDDKQPSSDNFHCVLRPGPRKQNMDRHGKTELRMSYTTRLPLPRR